MVKKTNTGKGLRERIGAAVDTAWNYALDRVILNPDICKGVYKYSSPQVRERAFNSLWGYYAGKMKKDIEKQSSGLKEKYLTNVSGPAIKERTGIIDSFLKKEHEYGMKGLRQTFSALKKDLEINKLANGFPDIVYSSDLAFNLRNSDGGISPSGVLAATVVLTAAGAGLYAASDKLSYQSDQKPVDTFDGADNAGNDTDNNISEISDRNITGSISNVPTFSQDILSKAPFLTGQYNISRMPLHIKQPANATDQDEKLLGNFAEYMRKGGSYDREAVQKIISDANISVSTGADLTDGRNFSNSENYGFDALVKYGKVRKKEINGSIVATLPWLDPKEIDMSKYSAEIEGCITAANNSNGKNAAVQGIELVPASDALNLANLTELPQQLAAADGLLLQNLPAKSRNGAVWPNYYKNLTSSSIGKYMVLSDNQGVAKCVGEKIAMKSGSSGRGGTASSGSSSNSGNNGGGDDSGSSEPEPPSGGEESDSGSS